MAILGQEKKNGQHIKIVVVDKSGNRTEIDTLLKGGTMPDSIRLKNGEMISIRKHCNMEEEMAGTEGHDCEMSITVNSEKGSKDKIIKKVKVIAGDSTMTFKDDEEEGVTVIKGGKHFVEGKGGDVMVWSSDRRGSKGENII